MSILMKQYQESLSDLQKQKNELELLSKNLNKKIEKMTSQNKQLIQQVCLKTDESDVTGTFSEVDIISRVDMLIGKENQTLVTKMDNSVAKEQEILANLYQEIDRGQADLAACDLIIKKSSRYSTSSVSLDQSLLSFLGIKLPANKFFKKSTNYISSLLQAIATLQTQVPASDLLSAQTKRTFAAPMNQLKTMRQDLLSNYRELPILQRKLEDVASEIAEREKMIQECEKNILEEGRRIEQEEQQRIEALALEARTALITPLITSLEQYQAQRNAHYQLKDKLASEDKRQRTVVIAFLRTRLQEYLQSGEDDRKSAALYRVDCGLHDFPGIKLKPVLNKIKFELLSFGVTVTAIPEGYVGVDSIPADYNPALRSAIADLYGKLDHMLTYGQTHHDQQTVIDLEIALREDLDRFVIDNKTQAPTAAVFDAFKARFTARLHSYDDVLGQRTSDQWKPIVANILIALATVGIALVIKAAYSKVKTGRVLGFFSETEGQRQVNAIENSVNDIAGPVVAAPAA